MRLELRASDGDCLDHRQYPSTLKTDSDVVRIRMELVLILRIAIHKRYGSWYFGSLLFNDNG